MRILIAEDEVELAKGLKFLLEKNKFTVDIVHDGADALDCFQCVEYDVIVLDIMMPKVNGLEVLRHIRKCRSSVPVLMLTAKAEVEDRVVGLEAGADDYLPKPYSMKELLSRVNALIRRTYEFMEQDNIVQFGDVVVNISSRTVQKQGDIISLSLKEFDLLACLCQHRNHAVPKEKIINEVWGDFSIAEPSTLTVHIRWLREKIENDPANPQYIKTVYKVGYMLEAAG